MIKARAVKTPLADWIVDLPGLEVGISEMSILTRELYLWVEVVGDISLTTLRAARKEIERFSSYRLIVNVDSRDIRAVRFAEFFGFNCTHRLGPILVMEKF